MCSRRAREYGQFLLQSGGCRGTNDIFRTQNIKIFPKRFARGQFEFFCLGWSDNFSTPYRVGVVMSLFQCMCLSSTVI